MDARLLMSGMTNADGCRMTNVGDDGEHSSFLALLPPGHRIRTKTPTWPLVERQGDGRPVSFETLHNSIRKRLTTPSTHGLLFH